LFRALNIAAGELSAGRILPAALERELLAIVRSHDAYLDEIRLCNRVNELARGGAPVSRDGVFAIVGQEFHMSVQKVEAIYYRGPNFLNIGRKK